MMGYGFDMFGLGSIWMVLFWIAIIALVIWAVVRLTSKTTNTPTSTPPASALDILKKRYARGEITKEQFEEMRRDLAE